ncbi:AMP-binding protein, partial [Streptomyces sp. NPDC052013]|uniref:AMP-binding protein n=1 Tax=Streptomyces sp. NPDC052013 TaxID=3365679 RepID=UPI0037CDD125
MTYGELDRRSNQLAHLLRRLGVGPGSFVVVDLERSLDFLVAVVAVTKSGGAYVPLDPDHPAERRRMIVEDCRPWVVISRRSLWSEGDSLVGPMFVCLDADAEILAAEPVTPLAPVNTSEDLAYVIYTSGSTGRPKGVMVSHRNVLRLFSSTQPLFDFGPQDVWIVFHSFAFDFSVWEMWGALLFGGRAVVLPSAVKRDPRAVAKLLLEEGVTVFCQTPSSFRQVAPAVLALEAHPRLRYVIFGGEALEFSLLREWIERFGDDQPRCVNMYGITEATVHATYRPVTKQDLVEEVGSRIGVALPDLEIELCDERC